MNLFEPSGESSRLANGVLASRGVIGRAKKAGVLAGVAVLALVMTACGGDEKSADSPAAPSQVSVETLTELPAADTFATIPDAPKDPAPGELTQGEVLHPKDELVVYQEVNGKPIAKLPTKQIGSDTWAPVIARQGDWAQILLPARPNAAAGWVHATSDLADIKKNDFAVKVDLKAFKLEILEAGKSLGTWTVGIGKPEHATPVGRAYIMASIAESVNKYSPNVLPLSVHSETLDEFGGGPGTVALHTWPDDSHLGKMDSDGCIRVNKEALAKLLELPLGTVVSIA